MNEIKVINEIMYSNELKLVSNVILVNKFNLVNKIILVNKVRLRSEVILMDSISICYLIEFWFLIAYIAHNTIFNLREGVRSIEGYIRIV